MTIKTVTQLQQGVGDGTLEPATINLSASIEAGSLATAKAAFDDMISDGKYAYEIGTCASGRDFEIENIEEN